MMRVPECLETLSSDLVVSGSIPKSKFKKISWVEFSKTIDYPYIRSIIRSITCPVNPPGWVYMIAIAVSFRT